MWLCKLTASSANDLGPGVPVASKPLSLSPLSSAVSCVSGHPQSTGSLLATVLATLY